MALTKLRQPHVLAIFILLVAALFIAGHQPWSGHLFPPPWDKVAHLLFYGTLTLLLAKAFPNTRLYLLGLAVFAIGCADEIHQRFVQDRHPGLDDLMFDLIGIAVAVLVFKAARYMQRARSQAQ